MLVKVPSVKSDIYNHNQLTITLPVWEHTLEQSHLSSTAKRQRTHHTGSLSHPDRHQFSFQVPTAAEHAEAVWPTIPHMTISGN